MQYKFNDPFEVEIERNRLAHLGLDIDFKKLYSNKFPVITNNNNGYLWDELNFTGNLIKSGIYVDKSSLILKYLKNKKGKLLDVGFGNGYFEKRLKNFKLYGIDMSHMSVVELNKKIKGKFVLGSVLNIPFKFNYFDYLLCLDVLEHISPKDTFKALSQINKVLKKQGVFVCSVPLNENLRFLVKNKINLNEHVRAYTPDIIRKELLLSGFVIDKEIYLSAFKKFYFVKKCINLLFKLREPNLIIIFARKK